MLCANKLEIATDNIQILQHAYDKLPHFLKPKVIAFNKNSIEFDNGTKIFTSTVNGNAGRGII
jgi:hypothetical protein